MNEYAPGARLSLREDKDERDPAYPIPAATPCGFKKRAGSGRFSSLIPIARHRSFAVLSARRLLPFSSDDCCLRTAISHRPGGTLLRATGDAFYISCLQPRSPGAD